MENEFYEHRAALVADLIPYAMNSRDHSDDQIAQLAASIREFGFTNPIIIDEKNNLIAGHGRLLAARKLKMDRVPAVVVTGFDDRKRRALVIADNKLALNATWNIEALLTEVKDLGEEFGELMGFSEDELIEMLKGEDTEGLTDEDAVPEAPEVPITVEGDVWLLGRHRLMCGNKADMVFTDPPYGMTYGGGRAGKIGSNDGTVKKHGVIKGDDLRGDDLIAMIRDAVGAAVSVCKSGASKYICFPWRTYSEFETALGEIGLSASACIVWDKKSIGLGNSNYRPQHEFIFYVKGENWHGDKAQSDVWYMSRGATVAYVHPTQKPVELVEKAIANSSKGQDIVIDVFGGSGSTLIACEKISRDSRTMELDPKYCDVIILRWQEFTGQEATHAESGETFSQLSK